MNIPAGNSRVWLRLAAIAALVIANVFAQMTIRTLQKHVLLLQQVCPVAAPAPANACAPVHQMPDKQDCQGHDGGITCTLNDIPPMSWGACLESKAEDWTCLKDGTISHYKTGPDPDWSVPAKQCPALAEQIKKGDRGQPSLPIEAPITPRPRKKA